MSTARISTRALRALTSKTTTRSLSITGQSPFSSILTSDKPSGTRPAPRLPNTPPPTPDSTNPTRHFNTSRTLKAVNDSSTIDFTYLPESASDTPRSPAFRVPILPGREASAAVKARNTEAEVPVFIPVVSTASADNTLIHAPSALSDTAAADFQALAGQVVHKFQTRAEGEGMTRQILNDLWEDIVELGQGGKPVKA